MNKVYILILLSIYFGFTNSLVYGQEDNLLQKKADNFYATYNYKIASNMYLKLIELEKNKTKNLVNLADCYVKMNNIDAAKKTYTQLISSADNPQIFLAKYADILKLNGDYDEAKTNYEAYISQTGDAKSVANSLAGCDSAILWIKSPTKDIINSQNNVNTKLSEFGLFMGDKKMFFVAEQLDTNYIDKVNKLKNNTYYRIFNTTNNDTTKNLLKPTIDRLPYNKEKFHTGPLIINKANDTYFVTQTFGGSKSERSTENKIKYKTKNLELYIFKIKNGVWIDEPFPYNNVKKYSLGLAALSSDEKILYFVSDMPGGFGGTDIWYSELQGDNKWGQPHNAGSQINTIENEIFPTINSNDTLYFASSGHVGMGGLDIFKVIGNKNTWSTPLNLKYPINSSGDDFSYTSKKISADTTIGYISSNRIGGAGSDDIYSFINIKPKPPVFAVKGKFLKKPTQIVLPGVTISIYENDVKIVDNAIPNADGSYFFNLKGETDYALLAKKERYQSDSVLVSTKGLLKSKTFEINLSLDSLFQINKIIGITNIYYDFDKDSIRTDAAKILDGVVRTMLDNPSLEIELRSHTDTRGIDKYNLELSQRRATSAVNYIVKRGIKANRIIAEGYGESLLVNGCKNDVECTEEQHQANRRTDFRILKY